MLDNIEDLEEALSDILGDGFEIDVGANGQLIVYTGLIRNEDGDLEEFVSDEDLEEDPEVDPDLEPLDLEDEE